MLQKSFSDEYKEPTKNIHQSDPRSQPLISPFIQLYYFIVEVGAIPVRLLIHKNFGERSIAPIALVISFGFHLWYVYLYAAGFTAFGSWGVFELFGFEDIGLNPETTFETIASWSLLIINGFIIYLIDVFIINGKKVFKNLADSIKSKPINKSSYFRGDSVYFNIDDYLGKEKRTILGKQIIDEPKFRMLIEPQMSFYYGLVIIFLFFLWAIFSVKALNSFFTNWLAVFFISCGTADVLISLSSICLFLEEYGIYSRARSAALDLIDGKKDLEMILGIKDNLVSSSKTDSKSISAKQNYPIVTIYKS